MIRIYLLWGLLSQTEDAPQPIPVTTRLFGDTVSLPCPKAESQQFLYWYRQTVGQLPNLVASVSYGSEPVLKGEFKNPRFKVEESEYVYNLIIRNISTLDEATYFCGMGTIYGMNYGNATFLAVKATSFRPSPSRRLCDSTSVQYSLRPVQENTVCTGSEPDQGNPIQESFTPLGTGEMSVRKPCDSSPTKSCVYSLSKNNLSLSDAGTYYCAVATCGEILFGHGTNLNIGAVPPPPQ
ncbi:unnamed protein product [Coregonus sp. 'balchen']|nr:unnamed protein product [Coregonus sp. 'balchen']